MQDTLIQTYSEEGHSTETKPSQPPQLIVDHFSFEELHSMIGLFDEMSSFYGQLDLYKHSSTVDRKTLLILNGGGAWARNSRSYSDKQEMDRAGHKKVKWWIQRGWPDETSHCTSHTSSAPTQTMYIP
jgi:hypothetical protein